MIDLSERQDRIVAAIAERELDVWELAAQLDEAPFVIRAELRELRRLGLVDLEDPRWKLTLLGDQQQAQAPRPRPAPPFTPDVDGTCVHCARPLSQHVHGRCRATVAPIGAKLR